MNPQSRRTVYYFPIHSQSNEYEENWCYGIMQTFRIELIGNLSWKILWDLTLYHVHVKEESEWDGFIMRSVKVRSVISHLSVWDCLGGGGKGAGLNSLWFILCRAIVSPFPLPLLWRNSDFPALCNEFRVLERHWQETRKFLKNGTIH